MAISVLLNGHKAWYIKNIKEITKTSPLFTYTLSKGKAVLRLNPSHRFSYSSSFLILNTNFNMPRNILGLFTTTTFINQNLRKSLFKATKDYDRHSQQHYKHWCRANRRRQKPCAERNCAAVSPASSAFSVIHHIHRLLLFGLLYSEGRRLVTRFFWHMPAVV